ncbi:putative sodium/metabolite cotransporter BASS5, chloroplastic [Ananas comosus]|uniref:Putative sodium/metabolite cotransporter BASS5, chloroplastic n=1 Tax=Ananas comosus TaxID=4615 RepID=A0A199VUD2_ANACO|nr:putative sodium/metabolite cotransporter BASS5, chloroplastic [Ananas comosus]
MTASYAAVFKRPLTPSPSSSSSLLPSTSSPLSSFLLRGRSPAFVSFSASSSSLPWPRGLGFSARRCVAASASGSFEQDRLGDDAVLRDQEVQERKVDLMKILKGANSIIPHIVLGSTVLALAYPPSFTWFTNRSPLFFTLIV